MTEASFRCSCHVECLLATRLGDGAVEVAFWRYGQGGTPTLRWRLRHAWRVLARGRPYEDFVVLPPEEARRLAAWLAEHAAGQGT